MSENERKLSRVSTRRQTGMLGEAAACLYLQDSNYRIIERNWRCRSGEIDIIAEYENRLVFVEVRTRRSGGRFGTAAESVDRRKQQQVRETAQVYLKSRTAAADISIQFDVVAIEINRQDDSIAACKHYKSVF
ncbi:YraN family protein [Paenibacillus harenae]|uniref:YraN family protein n=1 Tax=Paenibacillus harenae TaxID=306543 RepID=UPI00048E8B7D|nr:YraN family protein [Paenibacillus harenae]